MASLPHNTTRSNASLSAESIYTRCNQTGRSFPWILHLSAETNQHTDEYGGSPEKCAKIVIDIIHTVHGANPQGFCVGIKLNSIDHQSREAL